VDESRRTAATRQFDQLVETYTITPMAPEKAAEQLKTIPQDALNPRYQGLYMLLDHHLKREMFDRSDNAAALKKLGVDLSRPKEHHGHVESAKQFPKPSQKLMEQGGIGKRNYDALLQIDHFVNTDSDGLIRLAKQQLDRLEGQMDALAQQIEPNSTDWRPVYEAMRLAHPQKADLLDVYKKEVEKARQFLKDKDLISFPKERLEVIETPDYYRDAVPFAAYLPQGNGRGAFFVTTVVDPDPTKEEEQLRAHHYGFIPPVVVHEAFPGHHLQHAHTDQVKRDPSLPETKTLNRVYDLTPYSPYFGEGWGVYSEIMMQEQGYYNQGAGPLSKEQVELAALRNLHWRAARAWLDPQIHTGKITYDQAVNYLVKEVLMERDRAELEVNRYFKRPTEVASYMVGVLQFLELRSRLQQAEGKQFQLKQFHDEIFKEGQELPVPVIARMRFDQPLSLAIPSE
jgi:uncharacterized protein (DUF885 family)